MFTRNDVSSLAAHLYSSPTAQDAQVGWRRSGETVTDFAARVGVSTADLIRLNPEYFNAHRLPDGSGYTLGTWDKLRLSADAPPESAIRPEERRSTPDRFSADQPSSNWFQWFFGGGSQRPPNAYDSAFNGPRGPTSSGGPTGQTRVPAMPVPPQYQQHINAVTERVRDQLARVGVSPDDFRALMSRVMHFESRFDPNAGSPVGARGLMQLMPDTAAEVARKHGIPFNPSQITDPAMNTLLGGLYLAGLVEQFGGRFDLAAAGYNAGPNRDSLRAGFIPNIAETQAYVRNVVPTSVA